MEVTCGWVLNELTFEILIFFFFLKDFLGRGCLTPDCKKKWSLEESAVIVKVVIIGPDGEEKSKCECAPPLPSVLPSLESTRTPSKIPLKRPR